MGKAADWLREERRNVLGHWAAVCLGCGAGFRYFADGEADLPPECPQCGGEIRARCLTCGARFSSIFAVSCDACDAPLRPAEKFGSPIRKPRP